ncbi:MAG: fliL [Myxococcaceae bacterium]|nr:fliL [Myxococcaceae bacterium]
MSESTEAAPTADPAAKPAKGGKLMTILALVNFLGVLGLGGYFFYTQQHAAAQPKKAEDAHGGDKKEAGAHGEEAKAAEGEHGAKAEEEEEAEPEAEHGKPAEGHGKPAEGGHGKAAEHDEAASGEETAAGGPLMVLDSMVTNLADPDSDRYLKVGLQMRITSEAAKAEVEAHLVPVRNQILLYLSSLTIADTSGAENKREIQKRIKRLSNEAMPTSRITAVYFTEFVIQ